MSVTADKQRTPRGTRRRRGLLSFLTFSSFCLHSAALICIILLAIAGTRYTASGSQGPAYYGHPGARSLEYTEFALVHFTTNVSRSSPTIYWFFNAFGWVYFSGEEVSSTGIVYRAIGQTLRLPDAMNDFLSEYNGTVGGSVFEKCSYSNVTEPDGSIRAALDCVWDYDNSTIATFNAATNLSVPTAPAFSFYLLVFMLTILLLPIEWIRCIWGGDDRTPQVEGRHSVSLVMQEDYVLIVHGIIAGAHLIAAGCVTGAAVRVADYLRNEPKLAGLVWDVSLGRGFLFLVWIGFLITALGSLVRASRWWIKQRLRATPELGALLLLASEPRRVQGAALARRASEHTSI